MNASVVGKFLSKFLKYRKHNNIFLLECRHGWDYDKTWYDNTLPMQLDWVCDKDSYVANWLSVGMAGNVAGTIIFNPISDS